MKAIVAVEDSATMRKRSIERARRLDKHEHVEAERRISFERPEDMASFLTSRRLGVLKAAMEQPRSVTELAAVLKRNKPAVFRDVRALKQAGLIELKTRPNPGHGRMSVVRAAATKFDFRYQLGA